MKFDNETRICKLLIDYITDLTKDIPEVDFNKQIISDSITPAWVLGHLSLEAVNTAGTIDIHIDFNKEWKSYFSQGTSARDIPDSISKELLMSEFKRIYTHLMGCLESVPENILNRENPSKILADYFPHIHNDVSHILSSHLGVHGGQIGMWRKMYGLKNKYGR